MMSVTDVLMVLATLLSPIIAVQVTRRLDDRNEEKGRKLRIFKTLMATRATPISPVHVEALNGIVLEFTKDRAVLDEWQQYFDHLHQSQMEVAQWEARRVELFVDLLYSMGQSVGYDFNKTQIKNWIYSPSAHGKIENEQTRIREMIVEVLDGQRGFPVKITNLPS